MIEHHFEPLSHGIFVEISEEHRFGTDAFLLTQFAGHKSSDIVCELGTGCGIIALLMQRDTPPQKTYAVDIQENAIEQLQHGIEKSNLTGIIPVCADMKTLWKDAPINQCSLVLCNPPYMRKESGKVSLTQSQRIARQEICCDSNDVCKAAKKLLKFGGRLCLCNRPDRLCDVICAMRENNIEPKRLQFVAKKEGEIPWLFLIEGKLGGKPSLTMEKTLLIYDENGNQRKEITDFYFGRKEIDE